MPVPVQTPSTGLSANDFVLYVDDTSDFSGSETIVANTLSFDLSGGTRPDIDITVSVSPAMEYVTGKEDPGTATFNILPDANDAGQNAIRSMSAGSSKYARVELADTGTGATPTGTYLQFKFSLQSVPYSGAINAPFSGSFTFRLSGPIVLSAPSTT